MAKPRFTAWLDISYLNEIYEIFIGIRVAERLLSWSPEVVVVVDKQLCFWYGGVGWWVACIWWAALLQRCVKQRLAKDKEGHFHRLSGWVVSWSETEVTFTRPQCTGGSWTAGCGYASIHVFMYSPSKEKHSSLWQIW